MAEVCADDGHDGCHPFSSLALDWFEGGAQPDEWGNPCAEVITVEAKQWTVQIYITEDGDDTHARAVLTTRDTSTVTGRGEARRNPIDRPIPEIGDELATSRALEDLAIRLHDVAADDIVQLAGPIEA